jgi:small subunit ribosomal protein S9
MAQEQENVPPQPLPPVTLGQEKPLPPTTVEAPKEAPPRVAPPLPEGVLHIWGTGRRKKAIARVRVKPGTGTFTVNKKPYDQFFTEDKDRRAVLSPLTTVNMVKAWDVIADVRGGGFAGQAGALTLGLARALIKALPEVEIALRDQGLLTRDARMKERKKYGQKGARKRFQFSKR